MRFRNLRIAWSVVWALFAVLLIVLWVRSCWWEDLIVTTRFAQIINIASTRGRLEFIGNEAFPGWGSPPTTIRHIPVEEQPDLWEVNSKIARRALGFGVIYRPKDSSFAVPLTALSIPFWFLVLLSTFFAVATWYRGIPRKFSLRTLLIATTLLAVVLGLIVYATNN